MDRYVVMIVESAGGLLGCRPISDPLASEQACMDWLRQEGQERIVYQIVHLVGERLCVDYQREITRMVRPVAPEAP
jgi:hypothetical protein